MRIKPNVRKIKSLDEVNDALIDISQAEIALEAIDAEATEQIQKCKEQAAKQGALHRARIKELSAMINAYAEYNKVELFTDKKSIQLAVGVFGYRKSTKISVKATTIDLLKKLGLTQYINVKETPNKDAMRELDDEQLAQVDAVKKITDEFFVEPNREEVNKELLRTS